MPSTMTGWIQPIDVTRATGIVPHAPQDQDRLSLICNGLNAAVASWRSDLEVPTITGDLDPDFSPAFDLHDGLTVTNWNPRITLGLVSMAQRMYSGLGTGGLEQYDSEFGVPPIISREIEVLLEVGRGFRPVVA